MTAHHALPTGDEPLRGPSDEHPLRGPTDDQPLRGSLSVVVVTDGRSRARALRGLLSGPGFSVVAVATTATEAEAAVVEHRPGAVLIDLDPGAGGIEAIERIMGTRATPVVVCGDLAPHSQAALAAGAVDVIGALDARPESPQYASAVRRHLLVAARVRVITHPRNRLRERGFGSCDAAGTDGAPARPGHRVPLPPAEPVEPVELAGPDRSQRWPVAAKGGVRLVVVGASTGGPPALATILGDLPPDLPVPVLVVQHMADGFVEGLASWLDGVCLLRVRMAVDGARLRPRTAYVAPAGSNTLVNRGLRVQVCPAPPGQFHVPGVDATFASVAATCGADAIGVLLTGMGRDGAAGLRQMHDRGAFTIGQDEPTSVVWGMPAAAQSLGAVELELPLPAIGRAITAAVRERGVVAADPAGRR